MTYDGITRIEHKIKRFARASRKSAGTIHTRRKCLSTPIRPFA
jgi:hypothetical protein